MDAVTTALLQNPDLLNCELYHQWRDQEEDRINKEGNTHEANLEFALRDARLRRQAGLEDLAQLAFEDALVLAQATAPDEIINGIREEMNREK